MHEGDPPTEGERKAYMPTESQYGVLVSVQLIEGPHRRNLQPRNGSTHATLTTICCQQSHTDWMGTE